MHPAPFTILQSGDSLSLPLFQTLSDSNPDQGSIMGRLMLSWQMLAFSRT